MFEYLTPFFRFRLLLSYLLPLMAELAQYLFLGFALSRLSRALELPRPWLAWIPFGQLYRLGQLADLYTDNRMTPECLRAQPFYEPSGLRRKLLGYGIGSYVTGTVAGIAFAICATVGVLTFFLLLGNAFGGEAEPPLISEALFLVMGLIAFVAGAICLMLTVLFLMAYCPALCRVFTALGASSPTLITALSVIIPPVSSILLFAYTRKADHVAERFASPTIDTEREATS